jgi:arginine:ornithine antiporter/lysine permease
MPGFDRRAAPPPDTKVLGFLPLLALVVGSVVGSGIFNSPADLGSKANPGWILVAWAITGLGIFSLVKIFQFIADRRADLEGGIYSYAREVAGEFVGFNSAYGYWWSALFTNLAYFFAIAKILSDYFPLLAANKWVAFFLTSILLWGYYVLIRAGIRTAGVANVVVTTLKLTPLLFVVGATVFLFNPTLFGDPFATVLNGTGAVASPWQQLSGSFGVMVFAFLGIEGAVVISNKARHARDVGRVTLTGFLLTLVIYVLVSTFTMGVAPAREIVHAASPLGAVMGYAGGNFGRHFLNFGFLFSVSGALLSWLLLTGETPYIAALRDHAFPKAFTRMNRRATPVFSLTVTMLITQVLLTLLYAGSTSPEIGAPGNTPLLQNLYFAAISLSVICSLLPYTLSALLGLRLARREGRTAPVVYAGLCLALFAGVFVAMAKYATAAVVIYATGIVIRLIVHRERRERVPLGERAFYAVMLAGTAVVAWFVGTGRLQF